MNPLDFAENLFDRNILWIVLGIIPLLILFLLGAILKTYLLD